MLEVKSNSVLSIKVSTAPKNECVKLKACFVWENLWNFFL